MKDFSNATERPFIVKNSGHYFRHPSIFGNDGKQLIASVYGANDDELKANAELIVTAVNNFDKMKEALRNLYSYASECEDPHDESGKQLKHFLDKAKSVLDSLNK